MKTATMHQAKTNLSKYVAAAKRGEKVTLGYRGKPEVQITSLPPSSTRPAGKRKLGILKGKISGIAAAADYDKHTDPEWQQMIDDMYNKPL